MSSDQFLDGKVTLHRGDCLDVLRSLEENSLDSCVTDPPYGLQFMGREWDKLWRNGTEADQAYVDRTNGQLTSRARKLPDYNSSKPTQMQEFHLAWATELLRVLKPGAHLLAFSGTRTYHRMACAIEDAGFEIRDQIGWCYGSGFPKSHNIGNGWGTALKPAWEPIVIARKPISESSIAANVLKWGTGAINVDGCRVNMAPNDNSGSWGGRQLSSIGYGGTIPNEYKTEKSTLGRWPANLIHDGSEEVVGRFPETQSGEFTRRKTTIRGDNGNHWNTVRTDYDVTGCIGGDSGSVARFFYTAKADSDDRLGSKHPTVKPLDLIQYLVRLVTPKAGLVLDPFAGTGTLGEAAWREGFSSVLIEREPEYQADIVKRMGLCLAGPDERRAKSVKQEGFQGLPLFREG